MNRVGPSSAGFHVYDVPMPHEINPGIAWWTYQRRASVTLSQGSCEPNFALWNPFHAAYVGGFLVDDLANGYHWLRVSVAAGTIANTVRGVASFSVTLGASGCHWSWAQLDANAAPNGWVNLDTGAVGTTTGGMVITVGPDLGGGIRRYEFTANDSFPTGVYVYVLSATADAQTTHIGVGGNAISVANPLLIQNRIAAIVDQNPATAWNFGQVNPALQPFWQYNGVISKDEEWQPNPNTNFVSSVAPAALVAGVNRPWCVTARMRATTAARTVNIDVVYAQDTINAYYTGLVWNAPNQVVARRFSGGGVVDTPAVLIPDLLEHTWTAQFDGANLTLYLDGVLVSGPTPAADATVWQPGWIILAANECAETSATIFPGALTPAEILLQHNSLMTYG